MMTFEVGGGQVVCDPEGASVHEMATGLVVEVPVQYRRPDGRIDVGSVYIGTEPVEVLVREAHRWGRVRAQSAQIEAKRLRLLDGQATDSDTLVLPGESAP